MATAKPHNPLEAMSEMRQKLVRETLRNEFADFFVQMTTSTGPQWPDINDQELVDLQSVLRQPGPVPGWMQKFAERLGVTTRPMTPAVRMYRGQQIAPIVF